MTISVTSVAGAIASTASGATATEKAAAKSAAGVNRANVPLLLVGSEKAVEVDQVVGRGRPVADDEHAVAGHPDRAEAELTDEKVRPGVDAAPEVQVDG